jgi:hypothetical protein
MVPSLRTRVERYWPFVRCRMALLHQRLAELLDEQGIAFCATGDVDW